jgi:hypothetical protein
MVNYLLMDQVVDLQILVDLPTQFTDADRNRRIKKKSVNYIDQLDALYIFILLLKSWHWFTKSNQQKQVQQLQ